VNELLNLNIIPLCQLFFLCLQIMQIITSFPVHHSYITCADDKPLLKQNVILFAIEPSYLLPVSHKIQGYIQKFPD